MCALCSVIKIMLQFCKEHGMHRAFDAIQVRPHALVVLSSDDNQAQLLCVRPGRQSRFSRCLWENRDCRPGLTGSESTAGRTKPAVLPEPVDVLVPAAACASCSRPDKRAAPGACASACALWQCHSRNMRLAPAPVRQRHSLDAQELCTPVLHSKRLEVSCSRHGRGNAR